MIIAVCISLFNVKIKNDKDLNGSVASDLTFNDTTELSDGTTPTKVIYSKFVLNNVESLVDGSQAVVIGKVLNKKAESRNLRRNPENPSEEAKDQKTMSQEYTFQVDQWLKGNGNKNIDIVYPENSILPDGSKVEEGFVALVPGERYILFLNNNTRTDTWYGPAEPWQFSLSDKKALLHTKADSISKNFTGLTENDIISKVKAKVNK